MKFKDIITPKADELVIAGPCSVESRSQFLDTAKRLHDNGINVIRGGIWKPRTVPGCFEGIGAIGFEWMKEAKQEDGVKIATEIGNREQLEIALKNGVDIVWIGARSTTDPFIVQEIADTIAQHSKEEIDKVTFLIKNPVCPDYNLWLGAISRIYNAGVRRLGLVHRGFKTGKETKFRNSPCWDIVLRMRTEHPELPMYCDPSHITGNRSAVYQMAYDAIMTYGCDGLMIESHCSPNDALTDANQQIYPYEVKTIVDHIVWNHPKNQEEINILRKKIDDIDEDLINMLVERFKVCKEIGKLKKSNGDKILQPKRWEKVINHAKEMMYEALQKNEISFDFHYFIDIVWNEIHNVSVEIQNNK